MEVHFFHGGNPMRKAMLFVSITCFLIIMGHISDLYAQNITVTVQGDQTCTKTGTTSLTIAPVGGSWTCGAYTIWPTSSGAATVEIGNDASNDVLTLKNTKISRNPGTWPDLHITFSADNFKTLPNSVPPGDVWYQIIAQGFFKRGPVSLAVGSKIRMRGYNQTPSGSADPLSWFMLGSIPQSLNGIEKIYTVLNNNYLPVDYYIQTDFTALQATRLLRGEFWVTLINDSDTLSITPNMTVKNTTGGGPAANTDEPGCPPEQCVQCTVKSEEGKQCKDKKWDCPACVIDPTDLKH
jgi:hypothetical protein